MNKLTKIAFKARDNKGNVFTSKEYLEEIEKCKNSKEYFYNNYVKMYDKSSGSLRTPVPLNSFQQAIFKAFDEGKDLHLIRGRRRNYLMLKEKI